MARAVLNSMSTFEIVGCFVTACVVFAITMAIVIRKVVPDIAEREFEELASGLRVVYELLFALILAFAIGSVIGKFSQAEDTVDTEANALAQMLRDNRAFPSPLQSRLRDGIQAYVLATVNDEWKTMRVGKASREANAALDVVYALYQQYTPASGVPDKFYEQALAHLDVVATARRQRLGISNARLPTVLMLMLPVGAMLLLLLEYRPHLRPRGQVAFMGTVALVVSSSYLLTILLDYPFSGDVSVSSSPLTSGTLAYLANIPPRTPQPGDRLVRFERTELDGVFASDAYGTVVLQRDGNQIRGAYRTADGLIRGTIGLDGIFRGAWCEGSRRPDHRDAGILEWRMIQTRSGARVIDGKWEFGYKRRLDGKFKPYAGWDMHKLNLNTATDIAERLAAEPESAFCHIK